MHTLSQVRKPVHNKCFGIEIEGFVFRDMGEDPAYFGFFYRGDDGSLRRLGLNYGYLGYEWVSQPLPFHFVNKQLERLYKCVLNQYDFRTNASCGIHVHVSKTWFSNKKALAIKKFLQRQTDLSLFELWFGRKPNNYCDPQQLSGRYGAVNTTNDHTNEFRMFRSGTLEWAKYCVAMSKYMVENAYTLTEHGMSAVRAMHCQEEQYDF